MTTVEDAHALVHAPRAAHQDPRTAAGDDRLVQLGHHGRPQEDRDHVRHARAVLLRRRRHRGAVHPAAARAARRHDPHAPRVTTSSSRCTAPRWCSCMGMPHRGRVRQLPRPADDRRARRRVPAPQHARASGSSRSAGCSSTRRSRSAARPTAVGSATRRSRARRSRSGYLPGRGTDFWAVGLIMLGIGSVATAVNFLVHDPQHARAGHDDDAHAGVRVDDARDRVPHAVRDAARHRGADHGLHGPQLPHELLQCGRGRRSADVPEPVLDLRPSRGVHPHPPGHGHRLRDPAGVLAQAAVRLRGRRVLRHRDRLPRLGRVGAPHVRRRVSARSRCPRSVCRRCSSRSRPA